MSRHNIHLILSPPQARYLLEAVDADLDYGDDCKCRERKGTP